MRLETDGPDEPHTTYKLHETLGLHATHATHEPHATHPQPPLTDHSPTVTTCPQIKPPKSNYPSPAALDAESAEVLE